jgi:Fuc2NAc and GlcNAc transferase
VDGLSSSVSFLIIGVGLLAAFLTWLMRRYALSSRFLDWPNARSSHSVPTPRGGGVAIVAAFLVGVLVSRLAFDAAVPWRLIEAGIGVATVGLIDDRGHIRARWRLLAHFVCAGWILYSIGIPPLDWLNGAIDLGAFGALLAALYLVWMLNLYNFMDGIDGIAGVEALTAGMGGALAYTLAGGSLIGGGLPAALLAAAAAGFLVWNFPTARIFMGDVGSGFLGLMLGAISLQAAVERPVLLWCWLVLLGVFVVDATVTLLRRMLRREPVYEAHRSHAYQHASREFEAHRPVTLAVAAINLFWLLPWAIAIALGHVAGPVGLVAAYLPLLVLAFRFKAGMP